MDFISPQDPNTYNIKFNGNHKNMDFITPQAPDTYNIILNDNNKYIIDFLSQYNLIHSILDDSIIISADKIDNLDNFIKTTKNKDMFIKKFIYDLGAQIFLLKDYRLGIKHFNLKDIIVLNNKVFLFNNPNNIYSLSEKEYKYGFIDLQTIDKESQFIPPEFSNNELKEFYYSTSFYSFVKLLLFCFDIKIHDIQGTSLYYFCKRCLEKNPEDRVFLYI